MDREASSRAFLGALYDQTDGDSATQVSMYAVGESLGMDRDEASRVTADLMAEGLVEIKALSGAIALSTAGAEAVNTLRDGGAGQGAVARLGSAAIAATAVVEAVAALAADLKKRVGGLGLDFDTLSELTADLKTIDAQIDSPRPKTAVLRECLQSIQAALATAEAQDLHERIRALTG
jgi:hypothetical protein